MSNQGALRAGACALIHGARQARIMGEGVLAYEAKRTRASRKSKRTRALRNPYEPERCRKPN
jgi:hypothetical protein